MSVLIISLWSISDASVGGTEKFVIDLASLLSKKCSVTILSLGSVNLSIENVNTCSLNIIDGLNEYSFIKYLEKDGITEIELKLKEFIKKNKFDIAHCNSLLFANLIKDIPVIHTVHTNQEEFLSSFQLKIADLILRNIENDKKSIYVAPSLYAKESFRLLTKKIPLVITHAFRPNILLHNRIFLRKKYAISDDEIVFCAPSRLEIKQKGQDILLGALQKNKRLLPPFAVVLGGCDEQYLENKKYLERHYSDLKMVIECFSDKSDMYSLSDVIILPSRTESFGYAALESAMIGFTVFLSDIPPYREIAMGNDRIILFKNNEVDLAKTMVNNYKTILARKITPPSQEWKDKYSEDTMFQKYFSLYVKHISNSNGYMPNEMRTPI